MDIAQAKIYPVLMILTHPFRGVKNLLITLRCLERYSDLHSFKKIYILGNDSFGEHLLIQKYVKKYPNLFQDLHCAPPGHNPCVANMQNIIHEMHFKDVVMKMDDDMFVTPGLAAAASGGLPEIPACPPGRDDCPGCAHQNHGSQGPLGRDGASLRRRLQGTWGTRPGHRQQYRLSTVRVGQGAGRRSREQIPGYRGRTHHVSTGPGSHLSINCVLYDNRVMDKVYPYNLPEEWFPDGEKKFDESIVNRFVRNGELKNIIAKRSVVHHYAFNRAQVEIMQSHPIERVYDYLMRLGASKRNSGESRLLLKKSAS